MTQEEHLDELRKLRRSRMPSSMAMVDEAVRDLEFAQLPEHEIVQSFNELLFRLFGYTLTVLERYEADIDAGVVLPKLVELEQTDVRLAHELLTREGGDLETFRSTISGLLRHWHRLLRGYFLSISQSRKQRGGKDFEHQLHTLLTLAAIPHEMQSRRERADFLFPHSQLLLTDRPRTVLLSVKRTLRERWQQVVRELQDISCPNTYLGTAEEKVAPSVVDAINEHNIYVVVWDEVKANAFAGKPMVIGYNRFVSDITTHFMPQWPKSL